MLVTVWVIIAEGNLVEKLIGPLLNLVHQPMNQNNQEWPFFHCIETRRKRINPQIRNSTKKKNPHT